MKKFEELSEFHAKPYLLKNQAIEFSLGYNPSLSIRVKRAYLIDGKFFGLVQTGEIYHLVTDREVMYAGISCAIAHQLLDEHMFEQLDAAITSWLRRSYDIRLNQALVVE